MSTAPRCRTHVRFALGFARSAFVLAAALLAMPAAAANAVRPSNAEVHFRLAHPCPGNSQTHGPCKGYVIDRVIPLICGGAEDPENMRWLTLAESKAKKKWERIGCRPGRRLVLPGASTSTTKAFAMGESSPPVVQPLPPGGGPPAERAAPAEPAGAIPSETGEVK